VFFVFFTLFQIIKTVSSVLESFFQIPVRCALGAPAE
jgi:hypothetical protein